MSSNNAMDQDEIIITHYVSPQQFSYIKLTELKSCAVSIVKVEVELFKICSKGAQQSSHYEKDQHVIVRYQPEHAQKYVRGIVRVCSDEEYLIWAMDYGFTIHTIAQHLWPLPVKLRDKRIDILMGGVAHVLPSNSKTWTHLAQTLFGNQLDRALQLNFKVKYQNKMDQQFGSLQLRMSKEDEVLLDAADYLVKNKFALPGGADQMLIGVATSWQDMHSIALAELNTDQNEGSSRSRNIMKLVAMEAANLSNPKPTYTDIYFNYQKAIQKVELWNSKTPHKRGVKAQNLERPSVQSQKLDALLENRVVPQIPETAKLLSKVKGKDDSIVESALRSRSSNSSSLNCSSSSSCSINGKSNGSSSGSSSGSSTDGINDLSIVAPRCDVECKQLQQQSTDPLKIINRNVLLMYKQPIAEIIELKRPIIEQKPDRNVLIEQRASNVLTEQQALGQKQQSNALTQKQALSKQQQSNALTQQQAFSKQQQSNVLTQQQAFIKQQQSNVLSSNQQSNVLTQQPSLWNTFRPKASDPKKLNNVWDKNEQQSSISKQEQVEKSAASALKMANDQSKTTLTSLKMQNKPSPVATSTAAAPATVYPKAVVMDKEKLDRIFNEMRGTLLPPKSDTCLAQSSERQQFQQPNKTRNAHNMNNLVLAHSAVPVQPIGNMQKANLSPDISKAMCNLNFHTPLPIQRYAWPHLLQRNSFFLVSGSGTGRSWCYLPALCTLVMQRMREANTTAKHVNGPLAVLLAHSINSALTLANHCTFLLQSHSTNTYKVVNAHAHGIEEVCAMLINGCGIFVSTVPHFVVLLQRQRHGLQLFDARRLEHIALDDYDLMQEAVPLLLEEVLLSLRKMSLPHLQIIIISQQWHARVFMNLRQVAKNPLLIFSNFLEAAIYGCMKLDAVVLQANKKAQKLLEYLATRKMLAERTLIYCKDEEHLWTLHGALRAAGHQCLKLAEADKQQPGQLLLLTDGVEQPQLPIRNIQLLVHFSLPESWSKFVARFHAVVDNIPNCFVAQTLVEPRVHSYVMLDEHNTRELPRLVRFFDAHGIQLQEHIRELATSFQKQSSRQRPMCPMLLNMGECGQKQCFNRHFFTKHDLLGREEEQQLPWQRPGNLLRCQLVKLFCPMHIAVKPLSYKARDDKHWQRVHVSDNVGKLTLALNIHMSNSDNRTFYWPTQPNEVAIIRQGVQYKRVRVLDHHKDKATVKLMDENMEVVTVKKGELFACDMKFLHQPSLAMDVILPGIRPAMGEMTWTRDATKFAYEAISNVSAPKHLELSIDIPLRNMVIVKSIAVVQECKEIGTNVNLFVLLDELVRQSHGQKQEQHLQKLRALYEKIVPKQENMKKLEMEQPQQESEQQKDKEQLPITDCAVPVNSQAANAADLEWIDLDQEQQTTTDAEKRLSKLKRIIANVQKYWGATKATCPSDSSESFTTLAESEVEAKSDEQPQHPDASTAIVPEEAAHCPQSAFLNVLLQELQTGDAAAKELAQHMLQDNEPANSQPGSSHKARKRQQQRQLETAAPAPSAANVASALQCAAIADGAVHPLVKWHQTLHHVDLIFEQKVPQYVLKHWRNTLIYAAETMPPQRCILNLLGAVSILSEQQHGYTLHVKLAKHLPMLWPTLLSSVYAQQKAHWLVYDTDRDKEPTRSNAATIWKRFMPLQCDNEDGQRNEMDMDSSSDEFYEPTDVEGCADYVDLCADA